MFRRKKNKSNLEQLSGQIDKDGLILRDVANGASRPTRMVAPAGVERFSDDEDDMMPMLNAAYVVLRQLPLLCCSARSYDTQHVVNVVLQFQKG